VFARARTRKPASMSLLSSSARSAATAPEAGPAREENPDQAEGPAAPQEEERAQIEEEPELSEVPDRVRPKQDRPPSKALDWPWLIQIPRPKQSHRSPICAGSISSVDSVGLSGVIGFPFAM
jgi:hypothetical protein